MQSKILSTAAVVLAASSMVSAQTHSLCNPTKGDKNCPDDAAFGDKTASCDFTKGKCDLFKEADGTSLNYDPSKGAIATIKEEGNAPTFATSKYIFFGEFSVEMMAAPGKGIVSSIVLQSDDLDEIDWEWIGSDSAQVQTNFFSKGDTTTYDRGKYHPNADSQTKFHTYTIRWTAKQVEWIIDGTTVRTLTPGSSGFPQTPCQIKLGTWVGGGKDSPKGTVEWAGGYVEWDKAPFNAYYKRVEIKDYCGGDKQCTKGATSYKYTGTTGKWEDIKIQTGGSTDSGDDNSTSTSSSASSSSTKTSAAPSSSSSASGSATVSGDTTKPTNGIGFVGNNATNGTTTSSTGGAGPSPTGTGSPASAGVRSAASMAAVFAGGLLAAYFAL